MLPNLNERKAGVSRSLRGVLVAVALAVLALPTLYLAPASGAGEKLAATEEAETKPAILFHEAVEQVEFLPKISKAEEKILAALASPTQIEAVEMPLHDVCNFLQDLHAIEIQLDNRALEDAGVASDSPITRHVSGTSLRSALRLLLSDHNLTYVVRDDVLLITSQDEAESMLITRTYPVADLADGKEFDKLESAIMTTVNEASWSESGGPGNLAVVPSAGSFVISQTHANHDEILQLLRSLRASRDLLKKK